MLKSYVSKIHDLEGELVRLKNLNNTKSSRYVDCIDSDEDGFRLNNALFVCGNEYSYDCDAKLSNVSGSILEYLIIIVIIIIFRYNIQHCIRCFLQIIG